MKIPFTNVRVFERGVASVQTVHETVGTDWRKGLRPDLTAADIESVNAQIHRFARFKQGVDELLNQAHQMQRNYDAAVTTGYNSDFKGTYTSANAEILSSDYQTIARARTICKDTPQGKAVLRAHANNVVGHNPFKLDLRFGQWVKGTNAETGQTTSKFIQDEELNRAI